MHLLQIALDANLAAGIAAGQLGAPGSPSREGRAGELNQLLVIHLAGRGEDETGPARNGDADSLAERLPTISALPAHGLMGKAADWK